MQTYHFALIRVGVLMDDLREVALSDDADAIDFGGQVIREFLQDNPHAYTLWTMSITQDMRAVRRLPVGALSELASRSQF